MSEIVTITHVREAGYCLSGVRRRCTELGIDFRRLVAEGVPISELEHIDDVLVHRIIESARGDT